MAVGGDLPVSEMAGYAVSRLLEQRGIELADVAAVDVDAFFEHMAQRWSRSSLRTSAKMLRTWFGYCEQRGWTRAGIADAILSPRVYRHEGLPLGPTWDAVGRVLDETKGDDAPSLRDHAIILLLSVYGLRSGAVRRLRLDDIDWARDRIRFIRSKSKREETAPLEPSVGNAIARYLRDGCPETDSRVVFLTLRAPHRPLSAGGLYNVVKSRLAKQGLPKRGCGPHGLRHACARRLVESGRSFKEVGDHIGHRSPDATRIYAKVDLTSLRKVAFAVHRLVAWYREGADVQACLPLLSTYLGHVNVAGTQAYLTMTPELLAEASKRFERYAAVGDEENHDG